ncbi:MAG: endonuclease/exonuclease/phosphatase family protein [Planctomycetota bacterium]|nr:endonuclease/exonuclease/phosphatase family protein [Planctomycetota bacterium]
MLRAAFVSWLVLLSCSCSTAPAAAEEDTLDVLVWNVLHGANDVENGAEKALRVIRDAEPDLVLMQESYDVNGDRPTLGRWIAAELGWQCHQADSPHLCVLSREEITARFFHHPWHGVGVRVRDARSREFLAYSIWIDYRAFPGYELRDNPSMSDKELLLAESVRSSRLPQAQALLEHLSGRGHLEATVPLLVGGDWNTPSHLDWTPDTARVYRNRRAVPLPVSRAMQDAGFTDTFRALYPNPVQRPGITWSPMFRRRTNGEAQAFDRIDRLYLKNPSSGGWRLEPRRARVLPEVWEDEALPTLERTFPSDHGAVLIQLAWRR